MWGFGDGVDVCTGVDQYIVDPVLARGRATQAPRTQASSSGRAGSFASNTHSMEPGSREPAKTSVRRRISVATGLVFVLLLVHHSTVSTPDVGGGSMATPTDRRGIAPRIHVGALPKLRSVPTASERSGVGVPQELTFVVVTGPFPLMPKTCIVNATLATLPAGFPIIVALDRCKMSKSNRWCSPEDKLKHREYAERLASIPNVRVAETPNDAPATALTGNIRHAMQFVTTRFVCVVQHDLAFEDGAGVNWAAILRDVDAQPSQGVHIVSFTLRHDNAPAVECPRKHRAKCGKVRELESTAGGPGFMTQREWTDNNHIVRSSYMRTLTHYCAQPFPERCMSAFSHFNSTEVNGRMVWKFDGQRDGHNKLIFSPCTPLVASAVEQANATTRSQSCDGYTDLLGPPGKGHLPNLGMWRYGKIGFRRQLRHLDGRHTKTCAAALAAG